MYLKLQRGSGNGSGAATGIGGGAGNVTVREGVRVGKNMENKYEDAKSVERAVRNCVGNMENNQRAKSVAQVLLWRGVEYLNGGLFSCGAGAVPGSGAFRCHLQFFASLLHLTKVPCPDLFLYIKLQVASASRRGGGGGSEESATTPVKKNYFWLYILGAGILYMAFKKKSN